MSKKSISLKSENVKALPLLAKRKSDSPSTQGNYDMLFPLLENQGVQAREEKSSSYYKKGVQNNLKSAKKASGGSPLRKTEADNPQKTKLFHAIERKIVKVSDAEYLQKSDVTLGDKRKLTCMTLLNLLAYAL